MPELIDWEDLGKEEVDPARGRSPFMGSLPHSRFTSSELAPLGTQGATTQISPAIGRLRDLVGPTYYPPPQQPTYYPPPQQPTFRDISHRPQPTVNLADLLRDLVSVKGIDPSRLQPQQQPTFRSVSHRPPGPGDFPRPSPPSSSRNPVTKSKPMSPFFEPPGPNPWLDWPPWLPSPFMPSP
jgi:hypothetical protein